MIIAIFCLLFAPLLAEDEIRVELSTKESLTPIYVSRLKSTQFSSDYLLQLQNALQFDLNYSGYSKVVPSDEMVEKAISASDPSAAFSGSDFSGIGHIVKTVIDQKQLKAYVYSTKTHSLKSFDGITLTGDAAQDRRQVHKLSDAIVKLLFNAGGVATQRILYSVQLNPGDPSSNKWRSEIWQCDWDGKNAHQVTYEDSYSITPVSIPPHPQFGSDRFLYVCYKMGQPKIYLSSLKSRTGKRLLDVRGNQLLPAISPKRDKLAFICDATGRADLFVQPLDTSGALIGKPQQLFSYPSSTQASPTFSPDGAKIAFVSDKDGAPRIYVIPTSSSSNRPNAELISKQNRENTCPSWSPDGTKLAYSAKTNGVRQIWIYDFVAREERQLTTGPGNKENPVWALDSLHLVFNSTDPSSSELYMVNLNQPEAVKITQGPGKKHYPTWGTR